MRFVVIVVLCATSAVVGAAIDHYWYTLPLNAGLSEKPPTSSPFSAPEPDGTTAKQSDVSRVEVLGDRVRCDVRYQELRIPESEYRSFFDKCMGSTGSTE